MANILTDLITSDAIKIFWEGREREPLLGEALFDTQKKTGLNLEWMKLNYKVPALLKPSAFDAKPLTREKRRLQFEQTQMPFFREFTRFGEKERQDLLEFNESSLNSPRVKEIVRQFYDNASDLIDGARIVPEVMKMGLITSAKFNLTLPAGAAQEVTYDYDYDPNSTWEGTNVTTLATAARWSEWATSNPIQDILNLKKTAKRNGFTVNKMIVGYDTWNDIVNNEKIKALFESVNFASLAALAGSQTEDAVRTFFERVTGLSVVVYDEVYEDYTGTKDFFFPTRGVATFLPTKTVGTTYFGTTPEEADLLYGQSDADVNIIYTGIANALKKETLPVNIIHWVSMIVLPSFESMDNVFNIKYTA